LDQWSELDSLLIGQTTQLAAFGLAERGSAQLILPFGNHTWDFVRALHPSVLPIAANTWSTSPDLNQTEFRLVEVGATAFIANRDE